MKNVYLSTILLGTIIGFSGCSTAIKLTEYHPVNLKKGKHIPSKEQLSGSHRPKIIIMDIDDNGIKNATRAKLGKSMAVDLNKELSESGNVEVLKRIPSKNYKDILTREIKAAELGREVGEDIGQAEYLVSGQISNVTYTHKFNEASKYEDKKGRTKTIPPSMTYKSCVEGTLKVFSLPDLRAVKSKSFNECSTHSEDVRGPHDIKPSNGSLERKAGTEAVHSASYDLRSFFTPKGYIFEMRKNKDGEIIVKTTLGSKFGVKEGDPVKIYTMEDVNNPLTGETTTTEVKIGKGVVSDKVTPAYSWVIVKEIEDGRGIKLGDYIKVKYKKSWLDSIKREINSHI